MPSDALACLLALVSHELRSPLGVIRGYLRLLDQQGTNLTEQQLNAVAAALKAAERATTVLDQASTLAQLYRDDTVFDFKTTALERVLRRSAEAVALPSDPKVDLQLREIPPSEITADDALLGGALSSLISALVRAQAADATVEITAKAHSAANASGVAVDIRAQPPVTSETIRDLDLSRGGLGLDLPLAVAITSAHHGYIREIWSNDRLAGMVVWLPLAGARAAGPHGNQPRAVP